MQVFAFMCSSISAAVANSSKAGQGGQGKARSDAYDRTLLSLALHVERVAMRAIWDVVNVVHVLSY